MKYGLRPDVSSSTSPATTPTTIMMMANTVTDTSLTFHPILTRSRLAPALTCTVPISTRRPAGRHPAGSPGGTAGLMHKVSAPAVHLMLLGAGSLGPWMPNENGA